MYKVSIRLLNEEDAKVSWIWRNDPEIWKFTGSRPSIIVTPEIEKNWIVKVLAEKNTKRFAIIVDDIYVGNIQLTNITEFDAEYHIFIGNKNYWGKGVANLATQHIITFASEVLQLKLIYLYVNPDNLVAIKLYEKIGFKKISDKIKMVFEF